MVSKAKRAALAQHSSSEIPPPIPQKDLYHRINYTLQASAFLQNFNAGETSHAGQSRASQATRADRKGKRKADPRTIDFAGIARREMKSTRKMAAHTQLRLDPSIKRDICRSCGTLMIPGLSSRMRTTVSKTHIHSSIHSCLHCKASLRIPAPPTSVPEEGVFGPKRHKRLKCAVSSSKPAFHDQERSVQDPESKGHVLWRDNVRVENWGVGRSEEAVES